LSCIGEEKIWKDVKGQSIHGEDEFIKRFLKHVKGYEEVKEIPKSQRYIGRLGLAELLKGTKGRKEISRKAKEAGVRANRGRCQFNQLSQCQRIGK
jgi:hypothetical protein